MKTILTASLIFTKHTHRDHVQGGNSILHTGLTNGQHKLVLFFISKHVSPGYAEDGIPLITFPDQLDDQAELQGFIGRIWDMNMPLICVHPENDISQVKKGHKDGLITNYKGGIYIICLNGTKSEFISYKCY